MHWSKDPKKRAEVIAKVSQNRRGIKPWNRGTKGVMKAWNKDLPKEQQPRYGKPVSQKQIENAREIGSQSHPAWNRGLIEWSPRIREQEVRAYVLKKHGHKCTMCGSGEKLVIHHLKHYEHGTDIREIHNIDNLTVLCRRCHMKVHNEQKKVMVVTEDAI